MRAANSSVDTINAAATAIVTAESRVQPGTAQKRRWGGCWSIYWCFGSQKHTKRIGHAVLVPEPILPGPTGPASSDSLTHQPSIVLPFIAPPSSPASFLQSDPSSATQSPAGLLSLTSLSASVYSPRGPHSIFAIGPYAHETQLVSPPVFSTFTTEPSTAPLTPPPEPVHLTTPSSPEVPFAQLLTSLESNQKSREVCRQFPSSQYEFQSYQLYPGSPVGHLISPSSAINSGTSSPFPDLEFPSSSCSFPTFSTGGPPKLLSIEGLSLRKSIRRDSPVSVTPDKAKPIGPDSLEDQISAIASLANSENGSQNEELIINHRVSFELSGDAIASCSAKKEDNGEESTSEPKSVPIDIIAEADDPSTGAKNDTECNQSPGSSNTPLEGASAHVKSRGQQPSLGTSKEFKFDNSDGASMEPSVGSDWWANEKVISAQPEKQTKWSFFTMIQPGVS
ncbi:hypothetical protein H6P81_017164 [Aristolochia fimbriata]|uniref:Uncharacterized protein n=1 Tax=Aristolochia fimbriata TaxID=158543 RepID=A0AAV7DZD5_ARIFI|nr:hypothetical protein H6P81_017164 [Aristolochia fimbriata]